MPREMKNRLKFSRVERVTKTADFDGATIDRLGFAESTVLVDVQEAGTAGGALDGSNFWELKLYHAPESTVTPNTAGTWAAVPDDQIVVTSGVTPAALGTFATIDAATEDETPYWVGYIGINRYIRVRYEATGSPGSTIFSALHVQSGGALPAV